MVFHLPNISLHLCSGWHKPITVRCSFIPVVFSACSALPSFPYLLQADLTISCPHSHTSLFLYEPIPNSLPLQLVLFVPPPLSLPEKDLPEGRSVNLLLSFYMCTPSTQHHERCLKYVYWINNSPPALMGLLQGSSENKTWNRLSKI